MKICFEVINPKLISTNEAYMHPVRKCKNGRYSSYVCKSPYLKEVQSYYSEILEVLITDEDVESLNSFINESRKTRGLSLKMVVGVPGDQIYDHDASNFIKAVEDCISRRLKIDDSYNLEVSISKRRSVLGDWRLLVEIETTELCDYFNEEDLS